MPGKETPPSLMVNNRLLRQLFKLVAVLCVGLGGLGVFLPLLPTTPFLLLATFFSLRSSPAIHNWLINHRRFGPPLRRYLQERSISPRLFWQAIILMWLSMLFAIWLVKPLVLKAMLFTIAATVTFYMSRLMKRGKNSHALCEYKNHPRGRHQSPES